jgi:sulfide dehydrogenase cytochrome subunit
MIARIIAFASIATALHAGAAAAQNANPQLLSLSCAGCHGPSGKSPGDIPSINGRSADSLAIALRGFRADPTPAGVTVMNRIAKGYTEAEIDAVAREISASWR